SRTTIRRNSRDHLPGVTSTMHSLRTLLCALIAFLVGMPLCAADAPKPDEQGVLVVIDANGKAQNLKSWKFTLGTRHLGWLAPIKDSKGSGSGGDKGSGDKPQPEKPVGPECIELREENSTKLKKGILTLVAVEQIRAMDFDDANEEVTVTVATSDKAEDDVVLKG